jgi:hypothetical protein
LQKAPSIDIFCRVVDNYGDIGVCWRFARQLAAEHPVKLRLIVDDFSVFKKIEPRLAQNLLQQNIAGVEILHWSDEALTRHYQEPADAVIEAFACALPEFVIEKMCSKKSVWIDFEYLSAEDWVEECHAKPSPHPSTGLDKTLFFPGFTKATGGLIREGHLLAERDAFKADLGAQNLWRAAQGLPSKQVGSIDVSLFCYPAAPVEAISGVRLFVPEGVLPELTGPHIFRFPFLTSQDYDRLLWTCDLNFVRGEDSWTRAIWAGNPFIWQIYKQAEQAHLAKLQAFLGKYLKGLTPPQAEVLADFHLMWNEEGREGKTAAQVWNGLLPLLPQFSDHAKAWSDLQAAETDCATNLIRFIRAQKLKN